MNDRQVGDRHNRGSRYRRNTYDERIPYRNNEVCYHNRVQSPLPSWEEVNQEQENRQERATVNYHKEN